MKLLTKASWEQFEAVNGGEINDSAKHPAKIRVLHSTSIIAVNNFHYWDKKRLVKLLMLMDYAPKQHLINI